MHNGLSIDIEILDLHLLVNIHSRSVYVRTYVPRRCRRLPPGIIKILICWHYSASSHNYFPIISTHFLSSILFVGECSYSILRLCMSSVTPEFKHKMVNISAWKFTLYWIQTTMILFVENVCLKWYISSLGNYHT